MDPTQHVSLVCVTITTGQQIGDSNISSAVTITMVQTGKTHTHTHNQRVGPRVALFWVACCSARNVAPPTYRGHRPASCLFCVTFCCSPQSRNEICLPSAFRHSRGQRGLSQRRALDVAQIANVWWAAHGGGRGALASHRGVLCPQKTWCGTTLHEYCPQKQQS